MATTETATEFCTLIPLEDECTDNTHDCHVDAICADTQRLFTCECAENFYDVDSSNPGKNCEAQEPCCESIRLWSKTISPSVYTTFPSRTLN